MRRTLVVTSLVSGRTFQPLVDLKIDDPHVQLSPEKAREVADMLIQAAAQAEVDGFLYSWAKDSLGVSEQMAVGTVADFRAYKEAQLAREIAIEMEEIIDGS